MRKILFLYVFYSVCNLGCNQVQDNIRSRKESTLEKDNFPFDSSIANLQLCTEYPKMEELNSSKDGKYAGAIKNQLWPNGTTLLKVRFLEGDSIVKTKVMFTSREWEKYCGIHFEYVDSGRADITISFKSGGSWSCIGRSSLKKIPSMNFGWLKPETTDEEYHRIVLHEFGHALGMIHEHQNPSNNQIHWDSSAVYQYYQQAPNFWTKREVDKNLFEKYSVPSISNTSFDPLSIMLYSFPKELTINGYSTKPNSQLSEMDKQFISALYPR